MSSTACRAARQTFCRFHGVVHMDATPETHEGLITIALSLTGKPNGYQFGTDTGLDLGALTPAGTLTDAAVLALTQRHGASIYGPDSHVAALGRDQTFNIAGIRQDLRQAQRRIDIDTWVHGDTTDLRQQRHVNRALQLWTADAAHRISILAKSGESGTSMPLLPPQDNASGKRYTHQDTARPDSGRAFRAWFPQAAAA